MTARSVIIIGAGLAGLSTGCYAQMNGYRTQIFEHHTKPGGVCTAWKRKGYTIDGCIHWLMGFKPDSWLNHLYREVGAIEGDTLRVMRHYARYIDDASGQRLEVTDNLDRLAEDMKSLSPDDAAAIDELIDGVRHMADMDLNMDKPRTEWGPPKTMDYFLRYTMPVTEFAERFRDPFLRWCVTNIFQPTMMTAIMFMFLGHLEAGKLALVKGGSLEFSLRVARRYRNLGGRVTYRATVDEILVEGDRAVGVRLADGSEHRADIVVSAADGYSTIFKMLGGRYVDQRIKDRYTNWPMFSPILIISFGVAREFPEEPSTNIVRLQRPLMIDDRKFERFYFHIFNYDSSLAPPGKTVVQVVLRTDFDSWFDLQQRDRGRYDAEKKKVVASALAKLDTYLPGVASQVKMTDVATPYTFWRYTRNYRGAFEGWQMTPEAVVMGVEKTLPDLNNFYMAGQWVEPGGGIAAALYSGRNLVKRLCEQEGKEFSTASW